MVFLWLITIKAHAQIVNKDTFTVVDNFTSQLHTSIPPAKRLIKAGINLPLFRQSSISSIWKSVGMNISVEQKISNHAAILGALETNYGFSKQAQLYMIELPVELRYYFSIGKKMKERADPRSFFRHYVSLRTYNALFSSIYFTDRTGINRRYYRGQFLDHITNTGKYDEAFNLLQNAYFQIGSQFQIKRNHYLDVNVVVPFSVLIYNKQELTLATPAVFTVKYGIAWSK